MYYLVVKFILKTFPAQTYLLTGTDFDVQLLVINGISLGTWVC